MFAGRVQGGKGGEQNSDGRTCCVVQNSTQCCAIASSLTLSNTGLGRSSHLSSPHAVVFVLVFVLDLFKCRVVGRAHVVLSGQHSRRNARTSAAIMMGGGVRTRRAVAQVPNACGVGRGRAKASETARGRRRDDAPPADESRSCRGRSRAVLPVGVASVGWQCDGMGGGQGWLAGCWWRMRGGSQGPRPPLRVVCLFFFPPRNTVFPFSLAAIGIRRQEAMAPARRANTSRRSGAKTTGGRGLGACPWAWVCRATTLGSQGRWLYSRCGV